MNGRQKMLVRFHLGAVIIGKYKCDLSLIMITLPVNEIIYDRLNYMNDARRKTVTNVRNLFTKRIHLKRYSSRKEAEIVTRGRLTFGLQAWRIALFNFINNPTENIHIPDCF
jgi:hypothetical protein